ncbi:right-handed parallel beta-helix repeat-containing protein [Pontiellaceae bacterium B1224]|nr:right-handed parallel beta-helix repeat-containing protein [Pontiellaceae bacterium B1224]
MKRVFIGCTVFFLSFSGTASAREIVVEPGGKISTLPAARDAVRALRAGGEKGDVDVILKDGVYTLDETLIFELKDSAPKGAVTRYRAAEGASPLISGGRVIKDWDKSSRVDSNIWVAKVPWAKGDAFFHCLYDGSTLLPRARSEGFEVSVDAPRRKYAANMKDRIEFSYADNGLKLWENLEDLEVVGCPTRKWLVNYLGIESVDPAAKKAKLSVPATYNMFGEWAVENCIDHLDAPGEWVLNSQEGLLYYWPKSGTPGNQIIAPALNELIRVEGVNDPGLAGLKDQPVEGIVFEGLSFAHADRQKWLPEDKGLQHDWDMWDKADGLVRFRGARNCAIRNCTFSDSGSDGVRLDLFCQNITVADSTFTDLGGTGILLAGYGPGKKDVNKNNIIHNNEITRVGQLFLHSPGVFVWQSGHNRISHNHIYDQAYTGLVVSGVRRRFFEPVFESMDEKNPFVKKWSFPEGTREHIPTIRWDEITLSSVTDWPAYESYMHARGNIIEFNEVHDCLKLLHDGNCIYLSGNGDGNIVRYNVTYNHPQGAMIRTDDDSHGATVSHNLLFGTMSNSGIAIKGLNTCQHNIYVNCTMGTGGAGNTVDPKSEMSRNLFYFTDATQSSSFHNKIERVGAGLDYNLYYHEGGDAGKVLQAQRKKGAKNKIDVHSVAGDPMFVDFVHGDFSFKADSPALELGIEPLTLETVAKIGTSRDPFLTRFAAGMPLDARHEKE